MTHAIIALMNKRKMIKTALCAALLTGCASSSASSSSVTYTTYSNTSVNGIFDTLYAFQEYTADTDEAALHFSDSEELLTEYNNLYDIYNTYPELNNLKTINDNAGIQPVKTDQKIIDLLKEAKKFYEYSDGEFDITIGSLLKVWHTYREEGMALNEDGETGAVPTLEELQEAASHSGWDAVEIDEENMTVYINDPDVSLDVGGIAKGYAAEMAALAMEEAGMTAGFLNVGRNIRLVGNKPSGDAWTIGIADPEGVMVNGVLAITSDEPVSVVTSGDYERYYIADDGKKYSHIIDPATLYPAELYRSVTILTGDSGAADCLSTTLFTLSIEDGKKVIEKYEKDSGNHVDVVWIMNLEDNQGIDGKDIGDYHIVYTEELEGRITWGS